ncbi:MAG: hypothetical protein ACJ74G_00475 [Blastocatellia bacterium]
MRSLGKADWSRPAWLVLLIICLINCRRRPPAAIAEIIAAGEPDVYSATLTRLAVDGVARETTSGSVARRGDWRREQWTEAGAARALILRPDLGKGYLLDLDHRLYIEFNSGTTAPAAMRNAAPPASESAPPAISLEEVERALSDAPALVQLNLRVLGDETIEDHPCQVIEERATFADGGVEVTRSRRARDLAGLPLLIEVESSNGARLTTERRDVRLDVAIDDFAVPAGFRKVDQLPATRK